MTDVVPNELVDYIISFLSSKKDAAAAALTARSWLAPARRIIFHTLYIRTFYSAPSIEFYNVEEVLEAAEHFGKYVKHIVWCTGNRTWPDGQIAVQVDQRAYQRIAQLSAKYNLKHEIWCSEWALENIMVSIASQVLKSTPDLAQYFNRIHYLPQTGVVGNAPPTEMIQTHWTEMRCFPGLRNLILNGGDWYRGFLPHTVFTQHASLNTSLVSLEIDDWCFESAHGFCASLAGFPVLSSLTLGPGVAVAGHNGGSLQGCHASYGSAPPFRYLNIGYGASDANDVLLQWLTPQVEILPLETLVIQYNVCSFAFAEACYRTLKHLTLSDLTEAKDLAALTSLTDLSLSTSSVWDMAETIESLVCGNLNCVHLYLECPQDSARDYLSGVLYQPRFRRLRDLCVKVDGNITAAALKEVSDSFADLPGFRLVH